VHRGTVLHEREGNIIAHGGRLPPPPPPRAAQRVPAHSPQTRALPRRSFGAFLKRLANWPI